MNPYLAPLAAFVGIMVLIRFAAAPFIVDSFGHLGTAATLGIILAIGHVLDR